MNKIHIFKRRLDILNNFILDYVTYVYVKIKNNHLKESKERGRKKGREGGTERRKEGRNEGKKEGRMGGRKSKGKWVKILLKT